MKKIIINILDSAVRYLDRSYPTDRYELYRDQTLTFMTFMLFEIFGTFYLYGTKYYLLFYFGCWYSIFSTIPYIYAMYKYSNYTKEV